MHSYGELSDVFILPFSLNPCFNGKCTRTVIILHPNILMKKVLILVLMENALVLSTSSTIVKISLVLILVLMENALVPFNFDEDDCDILVLILVLMENALVLLVLLVFE